MVMLPTDNIAIYPDDLGETITDIAEKDMANIRLVETEGQQMWQCNECNFVGRLRSSVVRHYNAKHLAREVKSHVYSIVDHWLLT